MEADLENSSSFSGVVAFLLTKMPHALSTLLDTPFLDFLKWSVDEI
jgi:hypothetical protein